MKLTKVATIITLALVLAGCGHEPFPATPLEHVTTFSLGSAKFTPFRIRPTAEQLRTAAIALYDSFDTTALSASEVFREAGIDDETERNVPTEIRAAKPDKSLRIDLSGCTVRNGEKAFWYISDSNEYYSRRPQTSKDQHNPVVDWIGLAAPDVLLTLLPDQVLDGTPVYVLEFRKMDSIYKHGKSQRWEDHTLVGKSPLEKERIFLGKDDLLPRRVETFWIQNRKDGSLEWPAEATRHKDILGFVANSKLPDGLFPAKPPEGAKLMNPYGD